MSSGPSESLVVIEGTVSGLERTTEVSGTEGATTTHITLFILANQRVQLRTPHPPPVANGDLVRVAGSAGNGMFAAVACRDLTTGWISDQAKPGCLLSFMVPFLAVVAVFCGIVAVVAVVLALGLFPNSGIAVVLAALLPIAFGGILFWVALRAVGDAMRVNKGRDALLR